MFSRPLKFQTAKWCDPGSVIECSKGCRFITAEKAMNKLIEETYEREAKSESADEPDKSMKSESVDKPDDKSDDKPDDKPDQQ